MRRIRHDYRRMFYSYFGIEDVRHILLRSLEAMVFVGKK